VSELFGPAAEEVQAGLITCRILSMSLSRTKVKEWCDVAMLRYAVTTKYGILIPTPRCRMPVLHISRTCWRGSEGGPTPGCTPCMMVYAMASYRTLRGPSGPAD
jgi:hypothetical protein